MITAVDTNVLLDVFTADPVQGPPSRAALGRCLEEGRIVVCEIVWAETAAAFPAGHPVTDTLLSIGATYDAVPEPAALLAGRAWRAYRDRGGPRTRVVADFLVAAHATVAADRLLTRDRGFYRALFADLEILDPSV